MSKWWRQRTFSVNKRKSAFEKGRWQPVLKEEHILREIVTRLWLQGRIKVYRVRERIPGMGAPSTPGIPDLIGWIPKPQPTKNVLGATVIDTSPAHPLFIEVKRPGGVHRIAQTRFICEAKQDGCVAFFAESWDDVVRELNDQCGIKLKEAV